MFDGKTIWFVVRGIAGSPSNFLEWEYEARDFIIQSLNIPAVAISYATSFLTVWRNRGMRAQRLAAVIQSYAEKDWRINIIAHSEGTVVATDALRLLCWPRIEQLHLVCGACDADFERLGINQALKLDRLARVHCWMAGHDTAMQFEKLALGRILFQVHKPLGLKGPGNIHPQFKNFVQEHWEAPWDGYGHSDCWLPGNLERTTKQFLDTD
jgi:pimeloyl-ACP methyl ester carboxylesterase